VRGTTAIEYALIAGGIALAIFGAVAAVGQNVSALLNVAANAFH
jgi:Flp pilus assembly pilin Flp